MNEGIAFLLGIVQGLTEFLPVSSSGHLELVKALTLDSTFGRESLLFTIVLHFATALSTLVVFRKDISHLFLELLTFKPTPSFYFSCYILLSMIPATLVGLFMEDLINSLFDRNILLVGSMLILTGLLLFLADRAKKQIKMFLQNRP